MGVASVLAWGRLLPAQAPEAYGVEFRIGWILPDAARKTHEARAVHVSESPSFEGTFRVARWGPISAHLAGEVQPLRSISIGEDVRRGAGGTGIFRNWNSFTVRPWALQGGADLRATAHSDAGIGLYGSAGIRERLTLVNPRAGCASYFCPDPTPFTSTGFQPAVRFAAGLQPRITGKRMTGEVSLSTYRLGGSVQQRDLTFSTGIAF